MIQFFNKKMSKKRKGFTLIELVVVIAILGILAALAIPRLTGARDRAAVSAHYANIRTIESAVAIYEADEGSLPGSVGVLVNAQLLKEEPAVPEATGIPTGSYYINGDGDVGVQ